MLDFLWFMALFALALTAVSAGVAMLLNLSNPRASAWLVFWNLVESSACFAGVALMTGGA